MNTIPHIVKHTKKWIVVLFDSQGEVVGPIWDVESKIKPTRWVERRFENWFKNGCTYKIKEVEKFSGCGYLDSYVKAL